MTIHHEGRSTILFVTFGLLILNFLFWLIHPIALFSFLLPSLVFLIFIISFFRHPNRDINPADFKDMIVSPADGRVIKIEKTIEKEYFKKEMIKISIFMSATNVHLNRIPISGRVVYQKYHPGKKLMAFHPKSSHLNERNTVVIEDYKGRQFLFRQIAGTVARRIRYYVEQGDEVTIGNELGFIKFGSRVDIFLPPETDIQVKKTQAVKANKSIIARI